ncbi:MAG: putative Ig domain-containing protein [Pseudomonadota bacterium]
MRSHNRFALSAGSKLAWLERAAVLALAFSSVACDAILGIDPPTPRGGGAAELPGAGFGNAVRGEGGDGGHTGEGDSGGGGGNAGAAARPNMGDSLFIEAVATTISCPGAEASVALSASGGRPPYVWSLPSGGSPFKLTASGVNREHATLTGAPTAAANYDVKVQLADADGLVFARTISVTVPSVPVIQVTSVPSVCPDELYSLELKAEGGNPVNYAWSTDIPASTGLTVTGDHVTGKFRAAAGSATKVNFTLAVNDGGSCPAAPVALSIPLEAATATVCTHVDVEGQIANKPPPPLCLGGSYDETLVVRRGQGPFQVTAPSLPDGLAFDPTSKQLSGTASAAGSLTVRVKDYGSGRTIENSFALQLREKCWFAYVSSETGSPRLHLLDGLLGNRKELPAASNTDEVKDFEFSPDGKYLAYRLGPPSGPAALAIVKLATWQQQQLSFDDVSHYQWSPDSLTLAVAYQENGDDVLGGVDIKLVQALLDIQFPALLTTKAVLDTEPIWYGSGQLAFLAGSGTPVLSLFTTSLGQSGFGPPLKHQESGYEPGVRLRSAPAGLFVIPSTQGFDPLYIGADGSQPVLHQDIVIAPSGRYAARASAQVLSLFPPSKTSFGSAKGVSEASGCDRVLSWVSGKDSERIACVHQIADQSDELSLFDVDVAADQLSLLSSVPLSAANPHDAQLGRRRLFSATGARFGFTTADSLSVAKFASGASAASYFVALPSVPASTSNESGELAFSPDERMLLQHRGNRLGFFDFLKSPKEVSLSDALAPSVACSETLLDSDWCGAERPGAPFQWSPNSDLVAFQAADGSLQMYDLTWHQYDYFLSVVVNDGCAGTCVGQYAFQP